MNNWIIQSFNQSLTKYVSNYLPHTESLSFSELLAQSLDNWLKVLPSERMTD